MWMFKRRLMMVLAGLCLGALIALFAEIFRWPTEFPVARAILTVAAVFGLLLVGLYGIVRFILWLIVEPYRAHKREKARAAE